MSVVNLDDKLQDMVMNTLSKVYGQAFVLREKSSYRNQIKTITGKEKMLPTLPRIKQTIDYSNVKPETQQSQLQKFAVNKLLSFGFYEKHCIEALDKFNCNLDEAFLLLYSKYVQYNPKSKVEHQKTNEELLIERFEEKLALESIFESNFEEKIPNQIWIIYLDLNYLVGYCNFKSNTIINEGQFHQNKHDQKSGKDNDIRKSINCKNLLNGSCKYGLKCWYNHDIVKKDNQKLNENIEDNKKNFSLEIQFPDLCQYPFETPIIILKSSFDNLKKLCLLITFKLLKESATCNDNGLPSVFHIVNFLNNSELVLDFIRTTKYHIPDEHMSLFTENNEFHNEDDQEINLASHFEKGTKIYDFPEVLENDRKKIDMKLIDDFKRKKLKINEKLPTNNMKDEILDKLSKNRILLIHGDTGCGKSTQVPQIILRNWMLNYSGAHLNVICTQPRRLATIALAERVAYEQNDNVGNLVGYQIRLEKKCSIQTRLLFSTIGILLRKLNGDPILKDVTHLIIDEVHERSEETDFLLMILKDLLNKRDDIKIILMSATFNQEEFINYFNEISTIEIPGRTFPVTEIFLEDFFEKSQYVLEENSIYSKVFTQQKKKLQEDLKSLKYMKAELYHESNVKLSDEQLTIRQLRFRYLDYSIQTVKNIYLMSDSVINLDLIEYMIDYILFGDHLYPKKGTILVFLPGIAEIKQLYDLLKSRYTFSSKESSVLILPLHSLLSNNEQSRIFKKTNLRKIVLSTNIAETSITIDDCVFVIDSGKMKEKQYDSNRNMEALKTIWVSKANANQRKGRAGRVMSGICFRLYTQFRYNYHFRSHQVSEILRIPLESLILKIKTMETFSNSNILHIFQKFIEPPDQLNIEHALKRLENIGALTKLNHLTALGTHLSRLPVDVRIGKLMIYGAMFRCVDAILTVAACLSYRSPFNYSIEKKDALFVYKKKFKTLSSDQLTALNVYNKWLQCYKENRSHAKEFASTNFLSHNTMLMIVDIKYQFLELLRDINFVPVNLPAKNTSNDNILEITGKEWNINGSNSKLLTAIICAALYPNVAIAQISDHTFKKTFCGTISISDAKERPFCIKECPHVFLHKSSVNYLVKDFPSEFLLFQEKFETRVVYINDTTFVSALALIFFSSDNVSIQVHNNNTMIILNNGWIKIKSSNHRIAEMIVALRKELIKILEMKINDPLLNLLNHETGKSIIQTVVKLITSE